MDFLKVIEPYEINEDIGNGLAILNDATNIRIKKEINGINSLEFDIPNNSKKIQYVQNPKYWYEIGGERYFQISSETDTEGNFSKVKCRHIISLMGLNNVILDFPIMVGASPYEILEKGRELCGNDYWKIIPQASLPNGMKWVENLTDIVNGLEKISLWDLTKAVLELEGKGEIYYHNNEYAIVERLGKSTSLYWSPKKNIESIKKSINYADVYNCLLVLGANDMPLDVTKYPDSVIRSEESINKYGERFKVFNFSNVEDSLELEQLGLNLISETNPERVDILKLSVDVTAYELGKKGAINLGDDIRIVSKELNIDEIKRIIGIEEYPLQPIKSKYTIGDKKMTLEDILTSQQKTTNTFNKMLNVDEKLKTDKLEQISPNIQSQKNFVYNSSFEVYDSNGKPKHWDCSEGVIVDAASQNWGSVSLKIPKDGTAIQNDSVAIFPDWYETESNSTMICFSHKWGSVKVRVIDADGNPIPHTSKYNKGKVLETIIPYDVYYREFYCITFLNDDIGSATKKYRIEFTGMDSEAVSYIDNVMATINKKGIMPLYRDGPESISYSQIIADTGSGEGGGSGAAYGNNIEFKVYSDEPIPINGEETEILTARIYRKDAKTDYLNVLVMQSFILSDITSDVEVSLYFGDNKQYTIRRTFNGQSEDLITYQRTIKIPVSIIGEDTGLAIKSTINGFCKVEEDTSLSCVVSTNTEQRKILLEIPMRAYNTTKVDDGIIGTIYEDENGKVIMDVQCKKSGAIESNRYWLDTTEKRNIFNTIQELNFYASADASITKISQSSFSGLQYLKTISGLNYLSTTKLYGVFKGCSSLTTVKSLPAYILSLEETFMNCTRLKTVPTIHLYPSGEGTSPATLDRAFKGCSSLTKLNIITLNPLSEGYNVISSMERAFEGCSSLESISGQFTPYTVAGSCVAAFKGCTKLKGDVDMGGYTTTSSGELGWGYRKNVFGQETISPEKVSECFADCLGVNIISDSKNSLDMLKATQIPTQSTEV